MQTLLAPLRVLYSPAILIIVVWCTALILVAIGPVDYHGQPSLAVLTSSPPGWHFLILRTGQVNCGFGF